MERLLGDHRPATVARAGFLGFVSSSCSYAASALAKTLFARGADFTSSMVFMVASTNLVVELGLVLWLLIGWQFAVAEFVGGAVMVLLLTALLPRLLPAKKLRGLRERLDPVDGDPAEAPSGRRMRTLAGWSDAAGYTVSDLTMLRRELLAGFLIAGFLAELVPTSAWQALFVTGHGALSVVENVLVGPLLAVVSFVCSVGNVPLAAALWKGGISFGGVVSFVFADLITFPLLAIYRRYYGTRLTLRLLAAFWVSMSLAGFTVQYLFGAARLLPHSHPGTVVRTGFAWNATTVLDILALLTLGAMYWLYRNRERFGGGSAYATDPVCGMQVERANPGATAVSGGRRYYFCCDGCRDRFLNTAVSTAVPAR
jgi:uncharacterized membrane protein YraQ (UPF0718 family)/YHS domain-containing protein